VAIEDDFLGAAMLGCRRLSLGMPELRAGLPALDVFITTSLSWLDQTFSAISNTPTVTITFPYHFGTLAARLLASSSCFHTATVLSLHSFGSVGVLGRDRRKRKASLDLYRDGKAFFEVCS